MVGNERIEQKGCSMPSTIAIMYTKSLSSEILFGSHKNCYLEIALVCMFESVSLSDIFMCISYVCAYLCWCQFSSVCVHESQSACLPVCGFEIWDIWFRELTLSH